MKRYVLLLLLLSLVLSANPWGKTGDTSVSAKKTIVLNRVGHQDSLVNLVSIHTAITIEDYFQFMDSLVRKYDPITPYRLTEHLIVRRNLWIIDTLRNTDYYRMKARDSFV